MSIQLRISLFFCALVFFAAILWLLRNKKFNLKYSLLWLFLATMLVVLALFPEIVATLGAYVGVISPVNTVFLCVICFLLIILVSITVAITKLERKMKALVQLIGILEKENKS